MEFEKTDRFYLPPQERVLKTGQIGFSRHQNIYSNRTLMNNWVEERMATELEQKMGPARFDDRTTTNTTYRNPFEINPNALKKEFVQVAQETEREVLFSHGNRPDATSYVSMNQLVYKEPKRQVLHETGTTKIDMFNSSLRTEMAFAVKGDTVEPRRDLVEKKRREWEESIAEETIGFSTTYSSTMRPPSPSAVRMASRKKQSNRWGESTQEVRKDYHALRLRESQPIKLGPFREKQ